MAPEQHQSQPVDARTDQFAFCVTAWEAAYGRRPFTGPEPGDIVPPRDTRDVPASIEAALRRGLSPSPADRWPTLTELLAHIADDPAARRRRQIGVAVALVAVAASAAALTRLASTDQADPCDGIGAEIETAWNPAARAAIDTAFGATRSPIAAENAGLVATKLDAFSSGWTAARRAACTDHERHAQSDDLFDRRVACLDRVRARVAATVDILRHADAAVVRNATPVVAALPHPDDCADVDTLLGERPLPASAAVRATVADFNAKIERVDTLQLFGRYPEALAMVKDLYARSGAVAYPPLRAELAYGVGSLEGYAHDPDTEAALRRAADLTAEARSTKLYARTWVALAFEVGFTRARFDDATPMRTVAWQAIHLAGDDPDLTAQEDMNEAAIDYQHGDVAKSKAELERAITAYEKRRGPDSVDLVAPLNLLGVLTSDQDPDGALKLYQRAIAILDKQIGPHHPRIGSILGNMGNIAHDRGRFDEAASYDRRAIEIIEAAEGANSPDLATVINSLGMVEWSLGHFDKAYELTDRARAVWDASLGPEHPYTILARSNLAGLRYEQKRCPDAIAALEPLRAIEDKHPESLSHAQTLQYLGGCLNEVGKPAEAKLVLEQALELQKDKPDGAKAGLRFELGRALWALGDKARGVELARQADHALATDPQDLAIAKIGRKNSDAEVRDWLAAHPVR